MSKLNSINGCTRADVIKNEDIQMELNNHTVLGS